MTATAWRLIAIAMLIIASMFGCRATAPAPEPEHVGTLAPSYHSIAVQPVHATTDLGGGVQVVETDDGADEAQASVDGGPVEAPEVVSKGGGIRMGEGR